MRWICLLLVTVAICGCHTKQPYEELVDHYLEDHLKDPGSYQNVELGDPRLVTPMSMAIEKINQKVKQGEIPADSITSKLDHIQAFYIAEGTDPHDTLAWTVQHRYRARNSYGALDLEECTYYFNKSFTEIIKVDRK